MQNCIQISPDKPTVGAVVLESPRKTCQISIYIYKNSSQCVKQ